MEHFLEPRVHLEVSAGPPIGSLRPSVPRNGVKPDFFFQHSQGGVLHQRLGNRARASGKRRNPGFLFWREMHFHTRSLALSDRQTNG